MNTDHKEGKHRALTEGIIKVFYKVYNTLGYGFLEKVYVNAIVIELVNAGIECVAQAPIKATYAGHVVGEYFADILVDNKVIVEIKAARQLSAEHEAQLLNYLKATDIEVGILLNFGTRPEVKRKILDNYRK